MKPLGTISENLQYATLTGDSLTAHALLQGLTSGVLKGSDPYDGHSFDNLDFEAIGRLKEDNVLNINSIDLYSVQLNKNEFAMFFAKNEDEVRVLFRKTFSADAGKVGHLFYAIDKSMYTPSTKRNQTWREIRDAMKVLPAFAGVFVKEWEGSL